MGIPGKNVHPRCNYLSAVYGAKDDVPGRQSMATTRFPPERAQPPGSRANSTLDLDFTAGETEFPSPSTLPNVFFQVLAGISLSFSIVLQQGSPCARIDNRELSITRKEPEQRLFIRSCHLFPSRLFASPIGLRVFFVISIRIVRIAETSGSWGIFFLSPTGKFRCFL